MKKLTFRRKKKKKKHLAATLIDKPHQFSLLPLFCNYSAARLIAAAELRTHASFAVRSSAALRNMNMIYTGSECALYAVCVPSFSVCGVCVCGCVWLPETQTRRERGRSGGGVSLATYCMLHEEINASLAAISA